MPDQLLVRLVQATNLRDAAHFGVQDPYVSVTFGDELKRSKVCKGGGVSPKWEETITFDVFDHSVASLRLTVETKKFFVVGEIIGTAEISLTEVYQTGNFKRRIPLVTKDGRQRGEIEAVVKYGDFWNGSVMASISSIAEDDAVEDDFLGNSQREARQLPRDMPGLPDYGPTSPQVPMQGRIETRSSVHSSVSSQNSLVSAPHHPSVNAPSHTRASSHPQQPEATIFNSPPDHVSYPTVVQISPPVYPLTSSACNNWAIQNSARGSENGTSSEDIGSLHDGMLRSISLDSTPSDSQVAATKRQKEFRDRLEALRSETGRPRVKEEQEVDGGDCGEHDQGFYPEVKYEEPPVAPMYL
ncbi:hypothetical protein BSKO_01479 [Bryopsis sp. KO-2023]|nr:hypothetical protein BSKO_01479 [Bryopsis sp. KO-2023]